MTAPIFAGVSVPPGRAGWLGAARRGAPQKLQTPGASGGAGGRALVSRRWSYAIVVAASEPGFHVGILQPF